ncbi:MAG TPA: hypothetical protein VNT79_17465 [Phycisphaerae bacterium]|nr:hypothetical protein [Phycisphaerae bacterium]
MLDPVQNFNDLVSTAFGFVGLILEVFFGPVLFLVLGPLTQISEFISAQ